MHRRYLVVLGSLLPALALGQAATTPGALTSPHPTLEHLSLDWEITGDGDLDGRVTVRFRELGSSAWREAPPLVRVPGGSNEGFSWANRHAGSLFSLQPDTGYEVELRLDDPDGGGEVRTMTARTRPVPAIPAGASILPATPADVDPPMGGP